MRGCGGLSGVERDPVSELTFLDAILLAFEIVDSTEDVKTVREKLTQVHDEYLHAYYWNRRTQAKRCLGLTFTPQ